MDYAEVLGAVVALIVAIVGGSKAKWAGGERFKTAKRIGRVARGEKWAPLLLLIPFLGCQSPLVAVDGITGFNTEIASGQRSVGKSHGNASNHAEGYRRVSRHRPSVGVLAIWKNGVTVEGTVGVWLYEHGEGQATTLGFRVTSPWWTAP